MQVSYCNADAAADEELFLHSYYSTTFNNLLAPNVELFQYQ